MSAVFELLPVNKRNKIFEKKVLNESLKVMLKSATASYVTLHLLTDTLVITTLHKMDAGRQRLLYPPMPLTHIDIIQPVAGNIYEVRLSPFKMIAIACNTDEGLEFISKFKNLKYGGQSDNQLTRPITNSTHMITAAPVASLSSNITLKPISESLASFTDSPEAFNNVGKQQVSEYTESASPKISTIAFTSKCRPTTLKTSTMLWEKLSICICTINTSITRSWIALNQENSGILIFNSQITPLTVLEADTPTRSKVHLLNGDGSHCYYLFKFADEKTCTDFGNVVRYQIQQSVYEMKNTLSGFLVEPKIEWNDSDNNFIECQQISSHPHCHVASFGSSVNCGPVRMMLVISGPSRDCTPSTRLLIVSSLVSTVVFLNIELQLGVYLMRGDGREFCIRFYDSFSNVYDYTLRTKLDESPQIIQTITEKSHEAAKRYFDAVGHMAESLMITLAKSQPKIEEESRQTSSKTDMLINGATEKELVDIVDQYLCSNEDTTVKLGVM